MGSIIQNGLLYAGSPADLSQLNDVEITNPQNGQGFIWDATKHKWVNAEIHIVTVPVPVTRSYSYSGQEQTFEFTNLATDYVDLTNNTQTNAGTYTVLASLKNPQDVWSDTTRSTKSFSWTIDKANSSFTLSDNTVTVDSGTPTATVDITNIVGDGEISVSSSDTSVATATISNNVITIVI